MWTERHEGLTVRQEPFCPEFVREARRSVGDEHLAAIGETQADFERKDFELLQNLYDAGSLVNTVGRLNGRLFGYLHILVFPSIEVAGTLSASQLAFFAAKDFPGLGLRLLRSSIEHLKERGVTEVFLRAGNRGDGPRTTALYQRLGATVDATICRSKLPQAAPSASALDDVAMAAA